MIKILAKIQLFIGVLSLSIFFVTILIQIVTRHLGIAVIWTEEVANYSFIWSVFMGAAVMVNTKEHFSFDLLLQKTKGLSRTSLLIVIDSIVLLFALSLLYYGIEVVQNFWNYNWASLPAMKMGYVWISIPIMGLTMSIYSINHLIINVKELKGRGAKL
jgi:TRAP-type C4-dicarboxylate transport system permease small subunit